MTIWQQRSQVRCLPCSATFQPVAITLNHLNQNEATSQYLEIIESTSFIETAAR
jgi:hypothetical protein